MLDLLESEKSLQRDGFSAMFHITSFLQTDLEQAISSGVQTARASGSKDILGAKLKVPIYLKFGFVSPADAKTYPFFSREEEIYISLIFSSDNLRFLRSEKQREEVQSKVVSKRCSTESCN